MKFLPHSVAKATQWEIAKGHLRAMAAIDGAVSTGETERPMRWERSAKFIEDFIDQFEARGFHEGLD